MLAAGSVAAVSLTGCGMLSAESLTERALEEAVERASDEDIDVDFDLEGGQFSVNDGEGGSASFGVTTEIPADFQDVVAVPGGFEVAAVTEFTEDGQRAVNVAGQIATGSAADLLGDLDGALSSAGWFVPDEAAEATDGLFGAVEEMTIRMLQRGDDVLMVTVASEDLGAGPHQLSYLWMPDAEG